jgi:hypothetical protein
MRTTLELLEILRDKGRETGSKGLCTQARDVLSLDITVHESIVLHTFISNNLPFHKTLYAFHSDTERYAWLDAQIEKLKQEEK